VKAVSYLGDGRLLALTNGANLQYLCGYDGTSFLSLQTGLSLHSRHENGMMIHKNHALSHFDGKVEITDLVCDGCFVRHTETTRALTYRLQLPPYCHAYGYPPLRKDGSLIPLRLIVIPSGVPMPEGGATQKEARLLLAILGDAEFSADGSELRLFPGKSTLLCTLGQKGNELACLKQRLADLGAPVLQQSLLYRRAAAKSKLTHPVSPIGKAVWDNLHALFCASGGVLSGHGELRCHLSDQALVGTSLLHLGMLPQAMALADFLLSRLETLGYLPLTMSAEAIGVGCEPTDREHFLYPSIALFLLDLAEVCRDHHLKARCESAAKKLLSLTEKKLGKDGFGFAGTEFVMRKGALPPDRLLYGNAMASAEHWQLRCRLQLGSTAMEPPSAGPHAKPSMPIIDDPHRLGKLRLADTVYGPCPACREDARYIGWLKHAKFASYLCPACYAEGRREALLTSEEIFLPGSYALYCSRLYRSGTIDFSRLCRIAKQCFDVIDKAPASVSFYERALLASVLALTADPAHRIPEQELDCALAKRTFPLSAAECAAYLLAQPRR